MSLGNDSLLASSGRRFRQIAPLPDSANQSLSIWLNGDDGLSVSNGAVTAWSDQSGNGRSVTIVGSLATAVSDWGNGTAHTAVVFDGNAANHVLLPNASTLGMMLSDYEMFCVANQTVATSGTVAFLASSSVDGRYDLHANIATSNPGARFTPDGSPFSDLSGYNSQYGQVYGARVTSSSGVDGSGVGNVSINGIFGTGVPNAACIYDASIFLGRRGDGTFPLTGQIAEVLIYNRALTAAERGQVQKYLETKYFASGFGWSPGGRAGVAMSGGTGEWNTSSIRWWDLTSPTPAYFRWSNADNRDATFYGWGTVTLTEDITANSLTLHPFATSSAYALTGQTLTLTSGNINSPGTLTIASNIAGSQGITKRGVGTTVLSGGKLFSGPTSILAGTLSVQGSVISGPQSKILSCNFTNTTLSVTFNTAPAAGEEYKVLPGSTTQTYGVVSLSGPVSGRSATYNSATSTLTII